MTRTRRAPTPEAAHTADLLIATPLRLGDRAGRPICGEAVRQGIGVLRPR